MTIEEFIDKFAYAIEVEPSTLTASTDYKSLPIWDSLNTLSVIAMVDADYGVTIRGADVEHCTTVADLFEAVKAKSGK